MSTNEESIQRYMTAGRAYDQAINDLFTASKEAFPVGTYVRSEIRSGTIVEGVICGHCEFSRHGYVVVKNTRTGKTHYAYPYSKYSVFEVQVADHPQVFVAVQ